MMIEPSQSTSSLRSSAGARLCDEASRDGWEGERGARAAEGEPTCETAGDSEPCRGIRFASARLRKTESAGSMWATSSSNLLRLSGCCDRMRDSSSMR